MSTRPALQRHRWSLPCRRVACAASRSALMFTVPVFDHTGLRRPRRSRSRAAALIAESRVAETVVLPEHLVGIVLILAKEIVIGVLDGLCGSPGLRDAEFAARVLAVEIGLHRRRRSCDLQRAGNPVGQHPVLSRRRPLSLPARTMPWSWRSCAAWNSCRLACRRRAVNFVDFGRRSIPSALSSWAC